MKRILIVDDEFGARESLREVFCDDFDVATAENALEGLAYLGRTRADLLLLDLIMPRVNGVTFLKEVRLIYPDLPVIVISASTTEQAMAEVLSLGAVGFVRKPFDVHELRHLARQSLTASELPREREVLGKEVVREFPLLSPMGRSPAFLQMVERARQVTGRHVLLAGERGVGKEYVARLIHSWSPRSSEPFVTVSCGELPASFVEAEIFGEWNQGGGKGRRGAVDLACGSTLFIEDINKVPISVQASLERLLARHEYQRVGSQQVVPSTVTVIATIEGGLVGTMAAGTMLPGLIDKFQPAIVEVPALRQRGDDIPLLAYHFLQQLRSPLQAQTLDIEPSAMQRLREYHWPGNIRELRNIIERVLVLHGTDKHISAAALPRELSPPSETGDDGNFTQTVEAFERHLIVEALKGSNGTIRDAASRLGTTPRRLQYRMDKLKIRRSPY